MTTDAAAYTGSIEDYRRRKDAFFAGGRGPLKGEALRHFAGLHYFAPDPAWRFDLPVTRTAGESVALDTSTGEPREFAEFGRVTLPLPGGDAELTLYAAPGDEHPKAVFVPFRDATNAHLTYGAGRYLDAPLHGEGEELHVLLDFNLAYHPYCAYGDGWTCPLPPAQNWLTAAVEAGERLKDTSN